ncbi:hypothetical protein DICVIV_05342, partial [Dictyocaulus viviparus]
CHHGSYSRGTLRYCSINCHERGEQGRDDDLWCLLYLLVELRGSLPWSKAIEGNFILHMKKTTTFNELLWNCPIEFLAFAQHLTFSDPYDWELRSSIPESNIEKAYMMYSSFLTSLGYHIILSALPQPTQPKGAGRVREHYVRTVVSQKQCSVLQAIEVNPFPPQFFSHDPLGF